jgi:hypothetical protein
MGIPFTPLAMLLRVKIGRPIPWIRLTKNKDDSKARLDAAHKPMRNLAQRAVIQCCIKIRGL